MGFTAIERERRRVRPQAKGHRRRAPPEFKDKVFAVLRDAGYAESRSAKLAQEDFMALLAAMNTAGVHFA